MLDCIDNSGLKALTESYRDKDREVKRVPYETNGSVLKKTQVELRKQQELEIYKNSTRSPE
jgi:hypothetical protein